MNSPKIIKNLFFNGDKLQAIGRKGTFTDVFVRQGSLDGACCIYSMMMLLILHKKLDWHDLIDEQIHPNNSFVESVRDRFLEIFIGAWNGGHLFDELSERLNDECFKANLSKVFSLKRNKDTSVTRHELHKIIKAQLDKRQPVMLAYKKNKGDSHAVVAIGYSKEKGNKLRLYCLDPSGTIGYLEFWNNIIEKIMTQGLVP